MNDDKKYTAQELADQYLRDFEAEGATTDEIATIMEMLVEEYAGKDERILEVARIVSKKALN